MRYRHPAHVRHAGASRPLLSTPQGGFIAVDDSVLSLWRVADGRSFDELTASADARRAFATTVPDALACLAEAGLLVRVPEIRESPPAARSANGTASVSAVIIVSVPEEIVWLDECLPALATQRHALDDIVLVDNALGAPLASCLARHTVPARVHALRRRASYAAALNAGVEVCRSDFVLLLNADTRPDPAAVANLLTRALETPGCAAVAPKLKFWRAPAFLNGIGNRVPGWGWGTDNGIGQLDLGQLDGWLDVPSVCFSAALISRSAWLDVGRFDEAYPAYYEDSDWAYRARLLGYRIVAAPDAHVLHAFGGSGAPEGGRGFSRRKLRNALVGRVRFSAKIPGLGHAAVLLHHCAVDGKVDIWNAVRQRDTATLTAFASAAGRTLVGVPGLLHARRRIQRRRTLDDRALFARGDDLTPSMIWQDLPELTAPNIRDYYAPLIRGGSTRPLLEVTPPNASGEKAPTSGRPS